MPTIPTLIAPFEAIYIGNFGSVSVLTRVNALRTKGARLAESLPTEYTPVNDAAETIGNHQVTLTLSFLYDDDLAIRISRGLSITDSTNAVPGSQQYSLLLVHPQYDGKHSFWMPQIRSQQLMALNYDKGSATEMEIQFIAEFRDQTKTLILKDTLTSLLATIGARAPFSY